MPLPEELRPASTPRSPTSQNLPGDRWAGMLVGGQFLADFVPDGLPWVHLDIAGPAFNNGGPRGYTPKGGTGAGGAHDHRGRGTAGRGLTPASLQTGTATRDQVDPAEPSAFLRAVHSRIRCGYPTSTASYSGIAMFLA